MSEFLGQYHAMAARVLPVAVILVTFVINRLVHWGLIISLRRFSPSQHMWAHALLSAADWPIRGLIWLAAIGIIKHHFVAVGSQPFIARIYPSAMGVLVILIVTWFLLRLVNRAKENYKIRSVAASVAADKAVDNTLVDAVAKLSWACILVFAGISILQQLGVSLAGLLAFGGAAGIAVGFAAQTLVSNLFGGMTIYASHIFKIGEDIILPSSNLSGTVQHIGWRSTRVLGWDGKIFYVPNSLFNSSNVINHSRLEHRAMSENLLLRYQDFDKVEAIVKEGNSLLENHKSLNYFTFRFDSFGDQALKLNVYAWVQATPNAGFLPYAEFARVKEEILLGIAKIARQHGCDLTLPATNVYLPDGLAAQP